MRVNMFMVSLLTFIVTTIPICNILFIYTPRRRDCLQGRGISGDRTG